MERSRNTDDEIKVYPVQNYQVDIQMLHLQAKIKNFRKFGKLNNSSFFKIFQSEERLIQSAEYISIINKKFSGEIDKQIGIQKMSEALFENTKQYYQFQLILYLIFYTIPMLCQMFFVEEPKVNFYLMISCLTFNALLNIEEIIIFAKYQHRVQSKINIINILIFYLYFYVRIFIFSEQTGSPL